MPAVVDSGAQTVTQLVNTLPLICVGYFTGVFQDLFEKSQRYFSAKHAKEEFKLSYAKGVLPTALNSVKTPVLQVSAEYKNQRNRGKYDQIEAKTQEFRRKLLQQFHDAKEEEENYYWDTYLCATALASIIDKEKLKIVSNLCKTHKVTSASELDPALQENLRSMDSQVLAQAQLVIEVARNRALSSQYRARKKREHKAAVDVEMSGTVSGTVNEKTLEKTVAAVLQKREQSRRDKNKQSKQKGNILFADTAYPDLVSKLTSQRQESQGRTEAVKRNSFKRKIIKETASVLESASKRRRYCRVSDYPERFFTASLEAGVLFSQMKCRVSTLRSLRLMNFGVHQAPNVFLPKHIEYFLAVNLKYIFPQMTNGSLPDSAYADATDKIRQWAYFQGKDLPAERLPLYLASIVPREGHYPESAAYIEAGLLRGRDMLLSEASAVVPLKRLRPEPEPYLSELGCTVKSLQEFMLLNHYMAFITDKNLGLAVVTRDWYREQVVKHLGLEVYQQRIVVPWERMEDEYHNLKVLAEVLPKPIQDFLDNPDRDRNIPNFHAIPKIHKNPWKIRPIVPMHSFFTTRLAMVVHYYLHPLVNQYPWICQSSRQFVSDLLRNTRGKNVHWRMFTGDVQSMYTNILTSHLLEALRRAMRKDSFSKSLRKFLLEAVKYLNGNVFFQFDGQIFQQEHGIAMGLACGPTLANLFMGIWERYINVEEMFLFYRRYIDDVFALTSGEDPTDSVKVPGLVMDWESKDNIPFLDVEVHLHDGTEVCVRPYTKELSHYQYIPWNSGHPVHVKRGLVKTELLRISSLSAKPWYFDEKKKRLHTMLRARGYPEAALKAWMRQIQWRDPLERKLAHRSGEDPRPPLFVASEYNPAWAQVKLGPVWDEMLREMISWPDSNLPQWSGMMMSLQRTANLWDVVRRANRRLLQLDEPLNIPSQDEPEDWQSVMSLVMR